MNTLLEQTENQDADKKGTVVLSFCNGDVVIHLRVNKSVSVNKKGSIIIKDKKERVAKAKK